MAHTHIPHLPNEILYEIAGYVRDKDILKLRLSAKVFQHITSDRFATTFFETRVHRLSPKGVKALLKISEHPVLVRHIRTLIIGHDGKQRPAKYHDLFEQIFLNLATVGNPISLGLRRICNHHEYVFRLYLSSYHMVEFFEAKILAAALRTQLPLNNLVSDMQGLPQNSMFFLSSDSFLRKFWCPVSTSVDDYSQFSGLHIKVSPRVSDSSRPGKIFVEPHQKRLEVSHIHIRENLDFPRNFTNGLREIHLEKCDADYFLLREWLQSAGHQLEHLSLDDIRLRQPYTVGSSETWKTIFATQRNSLSVMNSCKFGKLWTTSGRLWLEGGDKTIKAITRAQVVNVLSNLAAGIRTFKLDG